MNCTQERNEPLPAGLDAGRAWVLRRAKLFEVGEYTDKGLSVGPERLSALAASFDQMVPVLIEHSESPLELGFLTAVQAQGGELFGDVALTEEAHALIEASGSKALSVGLTPDLARIIEVSLVRNPRVPDARLFRSDLVQFDAALLDRDETKTLSIDSETAYWRKRAEQAEERDRIGHAQETVQRLETSGRLLPSQREAALALLSTDGEVRFGEGRVPVRRLFERLMELQPPHRLFGEIAPGALDAEASENLLLPEEAAFYRRYFPGVDLKEIGRRK